LAGGFAAGLKPTGNKDAFALRRNALGLARLLVEAELDIDLQAMIVLAFNQFPQLAKPDQTNELREFIFDRMRNYYADQGFTSAQFDAVEALVGGPSRPDLPGVRSGLEGPPTVSLSDFDKRLKAVREFSKLPEAPALAAANKRIRNILRKVEGEIPTQVNAELLQEAGEKDLYATLTSALNDTDTALASRDYVAVLSRLATLRPQVDAFFDSVMVNVENENVRNNRLALLKQLADRFGTVAEIAQLSA